MLALARLSQHGLIAGRTFNVRLRNAANTTQSERRYFFASAEAAKPAAKLNRRADPNKYPKAKCAKRKEQMQDMTCAFAL